MIIKMRNNPAQIEIKPIPNAVETIKLMQNIQNRFNYI